MQYCFMIFIDFMLSSCGSDSNGGSSGNGVDQPSILNGSQQKYFELNEEQNNDPAFAEETGYSLDTNGIELIGTFSPNSLDIIRVLPVRLIFGYFSMGLGWKITRRKLRPDLVHYKMMGFRLYSLIRLEIFQYSQIHTILFL